MLIKVAFLMHYIRRIRPLQLPTADGFEPKTTRTSGTAHEVMTRAILEVPCVFFLCGHRLYFLNRLLGRYWLSRNNNVVELVHQTNILIISKINQWNVWLKVKGLTNNHIRIMAILPFAYVYKLN